MRRIVLLSLLIWKPAWAVFDPFTIITVSSAALSLVNQTAQITADTAATMSATEELIQEFDANFEMSSDMKGLITEVKGAQEAAQELGYTADEIEALGLVNPDEFESISYTLQSVTRAIRAAKRI